MKLRIYLQEAFRRMIDLQDCSRILYLSKECIHMVMIAAEIFRELTTDDKRRPKFLVAYSSEVQRKSLSRFTQKYWKVDSVLLFGSANQAAFWLIQLYLQSLVPVQCNRQKCGVYDEQWFQFDSEKEPWFRYTYMEN